MNLNENASAVHWASNPVSQFQAQNDQRAKITALEKCVSAQENLIKCQTEKLKQQGAVLSAQTEQMKQTETRY